MPSIIIVDDESIFRKGLRKMIGDLDPEWEIAGEARDGYEALQLIEELQPDALLTDIRMPRMDGIQLQQMIRERFPQLLCVVISGYDDFSYVQQSMRQGSRDYLMKPIEREELVKVLRLLKEKLHQQQIASSGKTHLEEQQIRQHVSEHLVTGLLRGSVNESDLKILHTIGIDFKWPYFTCMVIKLDKHSIGSDRYNVTDPSLFQLYIQQLVQEIITRRSNGICFILSETEVVALLNITDRHKAMLNVKEIGETIRRQITTLSNMTVTIGIGQAAEGVRSISHSYNEAQIALLYRLIVGGDKVLEYGDMVQREQLQGEVNPCSWEKLDQAINEGNCEQAGVAARAYVNELCMSARTPETVHQQLCKLLIQYYELAGKLGLTKQWLGMKDMKAVLFDICSISSQEELMEECGLLLVRLAACIAESAIVQGADPVEKSIRYIELHYAKALTLKEVADYVYLNAAYFSTLFKQRTGKSFVERLTEIRVLEAKRRMAHTDHKIAIIAEQTGFTNIRHFNRVFKNETGLSPKEYRDRIQEKKDKNAG
ncbi:two-component system response regulator YesN [Paenibacillus castaneae]|uniref:response regulator n=1 Tax=Paenibacillus castaneae TaxID=474957 RepID=UPI000C9A4A39|nr:response regulator [Paenibacillus castaneae]NIK77174.1 two-component system response regulator YesN [Paenibacillus castaneae]